MHTPTLIHQATTRAAAHGANGCVLTLYEGYCTYTIGRQTVSVLTVTDDPVKQWCHMTDWLRVRHGIRAEEIEWVDTTE